MLDPRFITNKLHASQIATESTESVPPASEHGKSQSESKSLPISLSSLEIETASSEQHRKEHTFTINPNVEKRVSSLFRRAKFAIREQTAEKALTVETQAESTNSARIAPDVMSMSAEERILLMRRKRIPAEQFVSKVEATGITPKLGESNITVHEQGKEIPSGITKMDKNVIKWSSFKQKGWGLIHKVENTY